MSEPNDPEKAGFSAAEAEVLVSLLGGVSAKKSSAGNGPPSTKPGAVAAIESSIPRAHFMQLEEAPSTGEIPSKDLERLYDLKVTVEVVLGGTKMALENILKLHPGSLVELNKLAGEPVDITVNGKVIAHAEVVVIEDNFGVKILEIIGMRQQLHSLIEK